MSKLTEMIWTGDIEFAEHFGKNNPQMRRKENEMYRSFDVLEAKLNQEQKEDFERCFENLHKYIWILEKQAFSDGFDFGSRLFAEAFFGAEQIMKYGE